MRIMIDIPEQMYKNAKEDMLCGSETLVNAIKNSKVQEPCEDAISRQAAIDIIQNWLDFDAGYSDGEKNVMGCAIDELKGLPSVRVAEKVGECKACKYFEYDSFAKVNGIPLIVAHEICSKWGDGCKTRENGYCFLFENREEGETK